MTDRIALPHVPRALRALTGEEPPAYKAIYLKVLDGALPAEQVRGRWFIKHADLPTIAGALGLKVPDGPKPRRARAA